VDQTFNDLFRGQTKESLVMKTIIRQGIRFGALAASLLGAASASAQTQSYCTPNPGMEGGFDPQDEFDPTNGLLTGTLLVRGDAKITPQGTLLLTDNLSDLAQSGNVTTKDQLDFSYTDAPANTKARPFHSYFTFSIGPNTGPMGGAGLAFLGHNNEPGVPGAGAAGLGYGGIDTSFAIEFDTLSDVVPSKFPDLKDNHIGFMVNGLQAEHPATFIPTDSGVPIPFATASRDRFHVWIDYAGGDSKRLDVYFSKTKDKPKTPISWDLHKAQYAGDAGFPFPDSFNMVDLLTKSGKPPKAYIGFSASTYGGITKIKNDHIIHEWEYSTTGDTPCACQGASACAATETTPACSAGPGTQNQGTCVECTVMDQGACTVKNQVCDPDTETCVSCNEGADCPADNPVCDPASHTCGPCKDNTECAENHAEAPYCAPSGACVECSSNADCKGVENVCDDKTGTCILPCSKDMPCPTGWKCDEAAGRCEMCVEGEACPTSGLDVIQGGGCACSIIGLSKEEGLSTCLLSALGLAAAFARRRNRRSP
jgi:hypothetical protein